jgi:hypothetical protein
MQLSPFFLLAAGTNPRFWGLAPAASKKKGKHKGLGCFTNSFLELNGDNKRKSSEKYLATLVEIFLSKMVYRIMTD